MNIIVCIKQVPGTTKVDIDEATGVLKRDGVDSRLNPYDLYAIETALKLSEDYGGQVTVITMGPRQATEVIKEAYMMGVNNGAILTDRAFAGADVLATSYAISQGIRKLGDYDLIICGKQTTDGDTAQVGPETAEFLGIPHVTNVTDIIHAADGVIRVEADLGELTQVLDICMPCLITVEKDIYMPRLPSYKKKLESKDRVITAYTLSDLEDNNAERYGLNGSPTQVEKVYPPEVLSKKITVEGSADEIAEFLYNKLRELKYVTD